MINKGVGDKMNYLSAAVQTYSLTELVLIVFSIIALIIFLTVKVYYAEKAKKWTRNGSVANRHDKDFLMATIKYYYGQKGAK